MLMNVIVAVISQHIHVSNDHMVHIKFVYVVCHLYRSKAEKKKALYKNQGHFNKVYNNIPISVH